MRKDDKMRMQMRIFKRKGLKSTCDVLPALGWELGSVMREVVDDVVPSVPTTGEEPKKKTNKTHLQKILGAQQKKVDLLQK